MLHCPKYYVGQIERPFSNASGKKIFTFAQNTTAYEL
jgi:hypothetical protein